MTRLDVAALVRDVLAEALVPREECECREPAVNPPDAMAWCECRVCHRAVPLTAVVDGRATLISRLHS